MLPMLMLIAGSCTSEKKENDNAGEQPGKERDSSFYEEPFRLAYHFSPKEHWMNDPNGLVYHQGIYHLFYQHYPEDIVWGPMHWGHATSEDLLHWDHQEIALFPDSLGYIFSGSAVVDRNNSSGLGSTDNPALVAIFTYHDPEGDKAGRIDYQTQGMAYSTDNGTTWTKYQANPVLQNPGKKDFRDPKVFWHDGSNSWIMVLAVGDHVEFYSSPNLLTWTYLSSFGSDRGAHGGVWECPDLFKLQSEDKETEKWVLLISINPGGPNGGSATQYFIGDFDGQSFAAEHEDIRWLDQGADNYAGVTYNNLDSDKRILIGWMSNWNYAQQTPTERWRSAMTLPRELSLVEDRGEYYVRSEVIKGFEVLILDTLKEETLVSGTEYTVTHMDLSQSEIAFDSNLSKPLQIVLQNDQGERVQFDLDPENQEIRFDRSESGKTDFSENFAKEKHRFSYLPKDHPVNVRLLVDRSSVEIFIDKGRYVMTERVFPVHGYDQIILNAQEGLDIRNFTIKKIKNIWKHE